VQILRPEFISPSFVDSGSALILEVISHISGVVGVVRFEKCADGSVNPRAGGKLSWQE